MLTDDTLLAELDRLDLLSNDNDPIAEREVFKALAAAAEQPSIHGAVGSFYLTISDLPNARHHLRSASRRAKRGWKLAYIFGRQVSLALADGELGLALGFAERGYAMARSSSKEITGRLAHQLALTQWHRGNSPWAQDLWSECREVVRRGSFFWVSASINLANLVLENTDYAAARQYLEPLAGARVPRSIAAYYSIAEAKLAAINGDFSTAADFQQQATQLLGSKRVADVGVSVAVSVEFLLRAGKVEKAKQVATSATRLIQKCGRKERAEKAALLELVRAGLSAELSVRKAQQCTASLRKITQEDQPSHKRVPGHLPKK